MSKRPVAPPFDDRTSGTFNPAPYLAIATLLCGAIASAGISVQAGQSATTSTRLGHTLIENWGPLPGGPGADAWGEVTGVAMNAKGNILALRRLDPPLFELEPSGTVVKTWGDKMFVWPHGLRIDREGFIWVTDGRAADGKGQQVFKLAPDGRVVMTLGTKGVAGEGPDMFSGPCDVAFAPNGDIFVADGHVNDRVVKFSKDGKFLKAWGRMGEAPGEFNTPHAIAMDSKGRVFVADRGNQRIQIFDQEGRFLEQWKQFGRPSGILIMPDDSMYVADVNDNRGIVVGSARDGSVRGVIQGTLPEAVAVDAAGAVYAGETTTGRILRKFAKP
jgi:sugar lactone lactonase YvrE